MMNNNTTKKITILLLLIALSFAFDTAKATDFTYGGLETYTVMLEKVRPSVCALEQFPKGREQKFHRAVCIFHNNYQGRDERINEAAINLLQENQKAGLPPVKQNFAALLEGLLHCRQAGLFFQKYKTSGLKSLIDKARFCRERRMAIASFSDVNWEHAYFDYEALTSEHIPAFTLKDRINEMSSCYATKGVLDPSLNSECGIITNMSDTEIENVVKKATDEVIKKYFIGAESPVSAMFARKVDRAKGLISSANKRITEIASKAAPLNEQYKALYKTYVTARDSRLDKIVADYKMSVLLSQSILDEYDRWKGGLFIMSDGVNNVDLFPKIKERSNIELFGELNRITTGSIIPKMQQLLSDIKIVANSDSAYKKQVNTICKIYFCELLNKKNLPQIVRLCRKPSMNNNPLCIAMDGNSWRSGVVVANFNGSTQQKTVLEICQSAGLPAAYAKIGISKEESTVCLKDF
ncbi:MAG: hypothetical protein HQK50_07725 [Oligoflexia bacterium]|nr:hypothetical protein [Oligoflexia bacterium]